MDMSKVPLFKTLLDHERISQDGYIVLYSRLWVCHLKLVEKSKLEVPIMESNGNLFTFTHRYSNYLECEKNIQTSILRHGQTNIHYKYTR